MAITSGSHGNKAKFNPQTCGRDIQVCAIYMREVSAASPLQQELHLSHQLQDCLSFSDLLLAHAEH